MCRQCSARPLERQPVSWSRRWAALPRGHRRQVGPVGPEDVDAAKTVVLAGGEPGEGTAIRGERRAHVGRGGVHPWPQVHSQPPAVRSGLHSAGAVSMYEDGADVRAIG